MPVDKNAVLNGNGKAQQLAQSQPTTDEATALTALTQTAAGTIRESIALTSKKEAAVVGVLEMALAMGCLMLAVPLSEATPRRILPQSLGPADTPKPAIPAPPDALVLLRSRQTTNASVTLMSLRAILMLNCSPQTALNLS